MLWRHRVFWSLIATFGFTLPVCSIARADTVAWSGQGFSPNWSDIFNWSSFSVPSAATDVVFPAVGSYTSGMPFLNGSQSVKTLTFAGAPQLTFSGNTGSVLTLAGGNLTQGSNSSALTVNTGAALGADAQWELDGSGVTLNGALDGGGHGFNKFGIGALNLTAGGHLRYLSEGFGTTNLTGGTTTLDSHDSFNSTTKALQLGVGATLNVSGGATLDASAGYYGSIGADGGAAVMSISGANSTFKLPAYQLFIGDSGPGSLVVDAGSATGSPELSIGWLSDGSLTIQNGGHVEGDLALVGSSTETTGTVTVASGSMWTVNDLKASFNLPCGVAHVTVSGGSSLLVHGTTDVLQNSASTLTINGATMTTGLMNGGAGTLSLADPATGRALTINATSGAGNLLATVVGAGGIHKTGASTQALSGDNTFSGVTQIDGGAIIANHPNALKNSTVAINVDNGLLFNALSGVNIGGLSGPGDLSFGDVIMSVGFNSSTTVYSGNLTDNHGQLNKVGTGLLYLDHTVSDFDSLTIDTGSVALHGGSLHLTSGNGLSSQYKALQVGNNQPSTTFTVDAGALLDTSGVASLNATINGSAASSGVMTVSGLGTHWKWGGQTTIGDTGPGALVANDSAVIDGDTFLFVGRSKGGSLTIQGGAHVSNLRTTIAGLPGNTSTGVISGPGSTLTAGVLELSGSTILATTGGPAMLTVENGAAVSLTGYLGMYPQAEIDINGGTLTTPVISSQQPGGAISLVDPAGQNALTVGAGTSAFSGDEYSGTIFGSGTFRKVGLSTLTLSGPATNTGGVIVDGGVLVVTNSVAGPMHINGGELDGNGTVGSSLDVQAGAIVSPGPRLDAVPGHGRLQVNGSAIFHAGSTLRLALGGTVPTTQYDVLRVVNSLTAGGELDVSLSDGYLPAVNTTFNLLGFGSLSGQFYDLNFAPLPSGLRWNLSQLYTTGAATVVAGLAGDFNQNGVVDAADYVVWRNYLGTIYTQADYGIWRAHFGLTATSGTLADANVPEPAGAILLFIFGLITSTIRRNARAS